MATSIGSSKASCAGARAPTRSMRLPSGTDRSRLVVASFLMLFVELVLIRWSAANVVYLAYFSNFVLLASFLGIGIGFLRCGTASDRSRSAAVALAAFAAFVLAFPVGVSLHGGRHFVGLFGMFALPIWVTLPVIFGGVTVVMALIAEGVARLFARFDALRAYTLDVTGSLFGIAAFSALSFLGARPVVWAVVIAVASWWLLRPAVPRLQLTALAALVLLLLAGSISPHDPRAPDYPLTASSAPS